MKTDILSEFNKQAGFFLINATKSEIYLNLEEDDLLKSTMQNLLYTGKDYSEKCGFPFFRSSGYDFLE
jgi:hypothetical protein